MVTIDERTILAVVTIDERITLAMVILFILISTNVRRIITRGKDCFIKHHYSKHEELILLFCILLFCFEINSHLKNKIANGENV